MARLSAADKRMVARINKTRAVFKFFGATPHGYDPGITGRLPGGAMFDFSDGEQKWIEPLLVELRRLRRSTPTGKPAQPTTHRRTR